MELRFYFPRFTEADLDKLGVVAAKINLRCPVLGAWLFGEIRKETDRRHYEESSPIDVRLPVLALLPAWS